MKYLFFCFAFIFSGNLLAQSTDFTGFWSGILRQKESGLATEYLFSITITQDKKRNLTGFSRIEINKAGEYGIINLTGKAQKNGITVTEHELTKQNLRENAYWCIKNYTLQYNKEKETLSGNWSASASCEGTMELKRQVNSQDLTKKIPKKKKEKIADSETIKTENETPKYAKLEIEAISKTEKLPENYLTIDAIKLALQNKETIIGKKVILDNIYFQQSTSNLLKESNKALLKITQMMQENKSLRIKISGHTDNIGSEHSNLQLSRLRGIAVMNYLIDKGIAENRLSAEGLGSNFPIRNNDSEQNRQQNRRVEFEIL